MMVEKKKRKKKLGQTPFNVVPEINSQELRQQFGAVDFVENISEEEETEILSLDSLREAFAALSGEGTIADNRLTGDLTDEEELPDEESEQEDEDIFSDELDEQLVPQVELEPEEEQTVELSPQTILEAMLFVGDRNNRPLSAFRAAEKMRNVTPEEIDQVVVSLNREYCQFGCPYIIKKEGDGYRMVLRTEFYSVLNRFYGKIRESRLSQQAIDTLAIVAYQQPITAEEVQKLRKQPSSALLNQLVRRGLLGVEREVRDKKKVMLYKTTDRFLELFQLNSLDDLPVSEEIEFR
jgi:segregation and condensation protein B